MGYKLLIIPVVVVWEGIILSLGMSARRVQSDGKVQDRMKEFAI